MDRDAGRGEELLTDDTKNLAADGMPVPVDRMPLPADEGAFTTAPFKGSVKSAAGPKPRSISKGKRYRIWKRDGGACVKCGSKKGLQVDHIVPVAHGGGCEEENLRILCGDCNLREGVKNFGLEKMRRGDPCG